MPLIKLLLAGFRKNSAFVAVTLVLCAIAGTPDVLLAHPDNVLPLTLNANVYAEAEAGWILTPALIRHRHGRRI